MKCPNCGKIVSFRLYRCDNCRQNLVVYRKIMNASNMCYNEGLEKAKARNLSAAVISLKKSLKFNKKNTDARNLLGLVYYEMGEVVEALSQWVISKNFQEENNDADRYMDLLQSNQNQLAAINQTIKKYNSALKSAKEGKRELALMQLEKIVSQKFHYVRAYQLLALIYMELGEHTKAAKILDKALKIDKGNPDTIRFQKELPAPYRKNSRDTREKIPYEYYEERRRDSGRDRVREREREWAIEREQEREWEREHAYVNDRPRFEPETDAPTTSFDPNAYKEEHFNFWPYLTLVLGAFIGIAVVYFLVVPTATKKVASGYEESFKDFSDQLAAKTLAMSTLESTNQKLQTQVDELQQQLDELTVEEEEGGRQELLQAVQHYIAGNDKEAAAILLTVKESVLVLEEEKDLYQAIKSATFKSESTRLAKKGQRTYNRGDFNTAKELLEQSLAYDETNDLAIYFMGRVNHRLGDLETAKSYYNQLIQEYPNSTRVDEAKQQLEELGEDNND